MQMESSGSSYCDHQQANEWAVQNERKTTKHTFNVRKVGTAGAANDAAFELDAIYVMT
jgi:hypothetical protein